MYEVKACYFFSKFNRKNHNYLRLAVRNHKRKKYSAPIKYHDINIAIF